MKLTLTASVTYVKESKIRCIKYTRILTGLGLKETKTIMDKVTDNETVEIETKEEWGLCPIENLEFIESIKELENLGIIVEQEKGLSNRIELRENIKNAIHICADLGEADVLEILAVAFKMIK